MKTCTRKYHYIYKITNEINEKYYIGRHSTDDLNDGYMGSGHMLIKAQKKYGIENFKREIIEHHESYQSVVNREIEIVTKEFVENEMVYNIALGGDGGYTDYSKKRFLTPAQVEKIRIRATGRPRPDVKQRVYDTGWHLTWKNRKRSDEDKKNKSIKAKANMENGKNPFSNLVKCPHCDVEGDKGNMMRWHFDNCKVVNNKSRKTSDENKIVCPHCGKKGAKAPMIQWHFDNCKERVQ